MQTSHKKRFSTEVKAVLQLTLPIFIAQFTYTSMGFVDSMMAGHFSEHDLAAITLGNSIWMPLYLLMTGTILVTTPKVANLFGARKDQNIGSLIRQSLWMSLLVVTIVIILLLNAYHLFVFMQATEQTALIAKKFLQGIALGMPAIAIYQVFRCLNDGIGKPKPSMVLSIIGLLLNIPINYIFVFGKLGLPEMGGAGCGLASASVMWFMCLGYIAWVWFSPMYKNYSVFKQFELPNIKVILNLLSVGVPIGVAFFTEAGIFSIVALLVAKLGDTVLASHAIALNFSSVIFVIPLSISIAVTVRVGQAMGEGKPLAARFSATTGIFVAFVLATLSTILILIFNWRIAMLYTSSHDVLALASYLIIFAAIYQLPDAIQVTCAGALRGYQDTAIIMLITLISYWVIAMPIGYTLALTDYWGSPRGPAGFWISLIIGLTFASIMLGWRFIYQSKKQIKKLTGSA